MQQITVTLAKRSYPIYIGTNFLKNTKLLQRHIMGDQVLIVSNETVAPLYLETLKGAFASYQCDVILLPDGEQYKSLDVLTKIFDRLIEKGHRRDTTIVALGGGVIGDIAGFAAACYQRGAHLIQIPTTLLAQVDSSVGGKTAVNHSLGKNMIGAFYQPNSVIIDIEVLNSLPERQYYSGLAEVVKYALLADEKFFQWLEEKREAVLKKDVAVLTQLIVRCCEIKASIVSLDEREAGQRALLNLGHTFAHAIESVTQYLKFSHGEAVAIGLCLATDLSCKLGFLNSAALKRVKHLLESMHLATALPKQIETDKMLEHMARDKKALGGKLRFILLKSIGKAFIYEDISQSLLVQCLEASRQKSDNKQTKGSA